MRSLHVLRQFVDGQDGATALEYAMIGSLVAMAIIMGLGTVGASLGKLYGPGDGSVANAVSAAGR